MEKLSDLPNLGKVAQENLMRVGIATPGELRAAGSREAFTRIRESVDPGACLSMLYGLEGAVQGVRWHGLDDATKTELKAFFRGLK